MSKITKLSIATGQERTIGNRTDLIELPLEKYRIALDGGFMAIEKIVGLRLQGIVEAITIRPSTLGASQNNIEVKIAIAVKEPLFNGFESKLSDSEKMELTTPVKLCENIINLCVKMITAEENKLMGQINLVKKAGEKFKDEDEKS